MQHRTLYNMAYRIASFSSRPCPPLVRASVEPLLLTFTKQYPPRGNLGPLLSAKTFYSSTPRLGRIRVPNPTQNVLC